MVACYSLTGRCVSGPALLACIVVLARMTQRLYSEGASWRLLPELCYTSQCRAASSGTTARTNAPLPACWSRYRIIKRALSNAESNPRTGDPVKSILPLVSPVVRGLVAALVISTTIEWAVAAETFEDGVAAYRIGDYEKAVEVWRVLAEQGIPVAQYRLGEMYAEGKGVAQSDTTAVQWLQRAADQGLANAQYDLGASYAAGLGVARNDAEAAKWFRRAAEQGMVFAQLNLGLMYAAGQGVPQSNVEAMTWLQLAVIALPPGGARSDAAHSMQDVADKMTPEQLRQANAAAKSWKAKPGGK